MFSPVPAMRIPSSSNRSGMRAYTRRSWQSETDFVEKSTDAQLIARARRDAAVAERIQQKKRAVEQAEAENRRNTPR